MATTVGAMFNPIGIALGTVLASEFVKRDTVTLNVEGMSDWLLFQAIFSTIATVLGALLFRDHPPTPASTSQEATVFATLNQQRDFGEVLRETWSQIVTCFKIPNFVALFFAFGIGLGIFNAITTVVEQMTVPICATPDDASLFGGLLIGLGLVGSGIAGYILDRTHRYKLALRIGFGFSFVFTIIFTLILRYGMIDGIAAIFGLLGFFMLPM